MAVGINVNGGYNQIDSLSSPFSLNGQFSPEIAAEEQALNRRQQIANLLMQRGLQSPQGQMAGRFYVAPSWVQGLSQLGSAAAGASLTKANDADRAGLADKQREITSQAVKSFIDRTSGTPRIEEGARPMGTAMVPTAVDLQGPGAPQQTPTGEVAMTMINRGLAEPGGGIMREYAERGPSLFSEGSRPQSAMLTERPVELQGPGAPVVTGMQPPNERDYRKAIVEAMTSGVPGLKEMAMWTASQREKAQDTATQREFLGAQRELDRDVKREGMEANLNQMVMLKLMTEQQANDIRAKMDQQAELNRQNAVKVAEIGAKAKTDAADTRAGATSAKPMPSSALRMQQEELDAIGTASSINADLKAVEDQIDKGTLKLGLADNVIGTAKNFIGMSDENSRNLASFKATMEKQRNDSLRLNKGVQTEGDATRAWNELFANINDPSVVKQRLGEIQRINERAANIRRMNVDVIRQNYGKEPLETSTYQKQPAAVGQGSSPTLSKEEAAELEALRKKYGR